MTHRTGGMTLESDAWIRLLETLERIASSLEKVAELAEQAAAHESSKDPWPESPWGGPEENTPPTGSADSPRP